MFSFVFCYRDKDHDQKQLGGQGFCASPSLSVHHEGKSGQDLSLSLEAGTEAESMEKHCLLARLAACLFNQDHSPRSGTAHSGPVWRSRFLT